MNGPGNGPDEGSQTAQTPWSEGISATRTGLQSAKGIAENLPAVNLPKGGGAVRGMGEKFGVAPVTGTGNCSVPVNVSPSRGGFGPELALSYDSGAGNGPFGFGWSLGLAAITRKTDKGIPVYDDHTESDTFILFGSEDLVPLLDENGQRIQRPRTLHGVHYEVHPYVPRIEGLFARIERWDAVEGGASHWRSITRDNITSLYGLDKSSRIADPADPTRIFSYLIARTFDDKGNVIDYTYTSESEDSANIDTSPPHEAYRTHLDRRSQRYLKTIRYGHATPYFPNWDEDGDPAPLPDIAHFEVVFDYGDHDETTPAPTPHRPWEPRPDPFSVYRAGFEIRTYRRCQRILMFHHFDGEPGMGENCLVRSTDLTYSDQLEQPDPTAPTHTFLQSVRHRSYRSNGAGYEKAELPPLEFEYSRSQVGAEVRTVTDDSSVLLPQGVDGSGYRWSDLNGEGVGGVLAQQAGTWWFSRNLSAVNEVVDSNGAVTTRARLGATVAVGALPVPGDLLGGRQQLVDLSGDGQLDLASFDGPVPGFFSRTADGWQPFQSFDAVPRLDWTSPSVRLIDLSGDGLADALVISDDGSFTVYPSRGNAGFAAGYTAPQPCDEDRGPHLIFADGTQSVSYADMSGDGLSDIVRIRNGEICYWPSLGHGRFGAKVVMAGAPHFGDAERFDPRRVQLADIDGSGTSDLLYISADGVSVWFNRAGNSWAEPHRLAVFPDADPSGVQVFDLLGNGTACLVWSSPLPAHASAPLRYVDLMADGKPHLLTRIRNNLGAETRVRYAPSTRFYLADELNGTPWISRLPFPVHCVERVETYDWIGRTRSVSRYIYRHGHFDGAEREFRGFGMVEQRDTEERRLDTSFPTEQVNWDDESLAPPVRTRTWFHTGDTADARTVSRQYEAEYWTEPGLRDEVPAGSDLGLTPEQRTVARQAMLLDDTVLPESLSPDDVREACRALKGRALRVEVFAADGSSRRDCPYTVTEQNFGLRCIQATGPNRHAVVFVHPLESLSFHYERRSTDPRVQHELTLEIDRFGNVLRSVSAAYPRRAGYAAPEPDLPDAFQDMLRHDQQRLHVLATQSRYTADLAEPALNPDVHRTPLAAEQIVAEITGVTPNAANPGGTDLFTMAELHAQWATFWHEDNDLDYELVPVADVDGSGLPPPGRRIVGHTRTHYRSNELDRVLELGELHSMALPGETYRLALPVSQVERIFGDRVPDETLAEGGYQRVADAWWMPSGRVHYSAGDDDTAAVELAQARAHFFLPRRAVDPFGVISRVTYDPYDVLVASASDPVGNVTSADHDYRVLLPVRVTDPNRNRAEVSFNLLGLVAGSAVRGKEGENLGDSLAGFDPDLDPAGALSNPLLDPAAVLADASVRIMYDLFAYHRTRGSDEPVPPVVYTLTREHHASDPGGTRRYQHSLVYSDGFGREIQRKSLAEPGPLEPGGPDHDPRWIGSGWTIFDNKGRPVRRYQPFFSATSAFEFAHRSGVSSVLFYDPPGRVVGVLHPDDSWEKTAFDVWRQEAWDRNDTVSVADPRTDTDLGDHFTRLLGDAPGAFVSWHDRRAGGQLGDTPAERAAHRDAAVKATEHANTPATTHFDPMGRACLSVADNGAEGRYPSRTAFDCEGRTLAVYDALGRRAVEHCLREQQPGGGMRYISGYAVGGARIYECGLDSGERRRLTNVAGQNMCSWDARGQELRWRLDALQRPTHLFVRAGAAASVLLERSVYGEGMPEANRCGRLFRCYDQGGLVSHLAYDFKGNLVDSSRQLARDYRGTVNWEALADLNTADEFDGAAAPSLVVADTFRALSAFDALNRPIQVVTPHSPTMRPSVLQPIYNQANLFEGVDVWLRRADPPDGLLDGDTADLHPVTGVDYDERGQRIRMEFGNKFGNKVVTAFTYDPNTFRLTRLLTTRPHQNVDMRVVQDLAYAQDPVGNLTSIRDDADIHNVVFFRNRRVEPSADYTYDALYRLTRATGREHLGQVGAAPNQVGYDESARMGLQHPADGLAMDTYRESYKYDAAGNIAAMIHQVGIGGCTRMYSYAEPSRVVDTELGNRLTSTSRPGDPAAGPFTARYEHDEHGNITRMPHLPSMTWDERDRLHSTSRQVVAAGTPETTYYSYEGSGERLRKVTDGSAAPGGAATRQRERIYLGTLELHRTYAQDGETIAVERETLHVSEGDRRLALIETRTIGNDPAPDQFARFQYGNHLGSALLELDDTADIISYEEYFPYGSTSYQAVRNQLETPKRYRYTSKERDEENDLYYHGARYYCPWLGRWTTCDPAGMVDGVNLYTYVRSNPISRNDPKGMQSNDPPRAGNGKVLALGRWASKEVPGIGRLPSEGAKSILKLDAQANTGKPAVLLTELERVVEGKTVNVFEETSAAVRGTGLPAGSKNYRGFEGLPSGVVLQEAMEGGHGITDIHFDTIGVDPLHEANSGSELRGAIGNIASGADRKVDFHFSEDGSLSTIRKGSNTVEGAPLPSRIAKSLPPSFQGPAPSSSNLPAAPGGPAAVGGQAVAEAGATTGRFAKAMVGVGVVLLEVAHAVGQLFTVVGAHNEAVRTVEMQQKYNRGGLNEAVGYAGTFVGGVLAGAVDDAFAAATVHIGSAPVIDAWEQRGAGPAQQVVGEVIRGFLEWTYQYGQ